MKKRFFTALLSVLLVTVCISISACSSGKSPSTPGNATTPSQNQPVSSGASAGDDPAGNENLIRFENNTADVGSTGASFKDGVLSITKAGSYTLTGTLASGCVEVNVEKTEQVELILDGVSITNPAGPAIFCDSADKLTITVKRGSENILKDGQNYLNGETGPNAVIYSDDDLTIKGNGSLRVIGLYKNGISSKNDITIKNVQLTVEAYNTAIRGKYSVTVESGTINITCGKDGIKATETDVQGKGFVKIDSGNLTITAGDDAIQAETSITIASGTVIKATAQGKKTNAPVEDVAAGVFK